MNKSGGISFLGLLQIALIVLKLVKVITCSWWVVLLPLEICVMLTITIILFIMWVNK